MASAFKTFFPLSHSHCNLDCAVHMHAESGFNWDSIPIESGLFDPTSGVDFDPYSATILCNIVVQHTLRGKRWHCAREDGRKRDELGAMQKRRYSWRSGVSSTFKSNFKVTLGMSTPTPRW